MNWRRVGKKAVATTIQSGTALLIGDGADLIEAATWQLAAVAALGGFLTFVHRTATEYLENTPDPWERRLTLDDFGEIRGEQPLMHAPEEPES